MRFVSFCSLRGLTSKASILTQRGFLPHYRDVIELQSTEMQDIFPGLVTTGADALLGKCFTTKCTKDTK